MSARASRCASVRLKISAVETSADLLLAQGSSSGLDSEWSVGEIRADGLVRCVRVGLWVHFEAYVNLMGELWQQARRQRSSPRLEALRCVRAHVMGLDPEIAVRSYSVLAIPLFSSSATHGAHYQSKDQAPSLLCHL